MAMDNMTQIFFFGIILYAFIRPALQDMQTRCEGSAGKDGYFVNASSLCMRMTSGEATTWVDAAKSCQEEAVKVGQHPSQATLAMAHNTQEQSAVLAAFAHTSDENAKFWLGATEDGWDNANPNNFKPVWKITSDNSTIQPQGCYKGHDPNLNIDVTADIAGGMTPDKCIDECRKQNKKIAAVSNGTECRCGDDYGTAENYSATSGGCQVPCTGNTNLLCGGDSKDSIYVINGVKTTTWGEGQPDYQHRYENCGAILLNVNTQYRLNDLKCIADHGYICETDVNETSCVNVLPSDESTWDASLGKCFYKSYLNRVSWFVARSECEKHLGGKLASYRDDETSAAIARVAAGGQFWMAYSSRLWHWIDGEDLVFEMFHRTGDVLTDQPDSETENCLAVHKKGDWYDEDCNNETVKYKAICQIDMGILPTTVKGPDSATNASSGGTEPGSGASTDGSSFGAFETAMIVIIVILIVVIVVCLTVFIIYKKKDDTKRVKPDKYYDGRSGASSADTDEIYLPPPSETTSTSGLIIGIQVPRKNTRAPTDDHNERRINLNDNYSD